MLKKLKVLHIHRFGLNGGAGGAISMRRLHFGLRKAGIDSKILCVRQAAESSDVIVTKPSRIEHKWNFYTGKITSSLGLEDVFNVNSHRIKKSKAYLDADIINFHRIPNVLSYLAFPSLTKNKPAVFTLCEMWALTGHCRHSLDCERWKSGCGSCPYLRLPPAVRRDGTHLQWGLKNWAYSRSDLTIVTKSKWMAGLAKQSMLNRFPIHHIPNGVDTKAYKPIDQDNCRLLLNIPPRKKVLVFVAQRLDTFLKGGDLLLKALQSLPKSLKGEIVLLVFGRNGELIADAIDIQTIILGYISDDNTKAIAYSAADLFVHPTRAEAFPNVALESIACGTPVVSFRVGGVPDLVRPGVTGHLSEPENANGLRDGIIQLLEDDSLRHNMSQQCRTIATNEYAVNLVIQRYIRLYRRLIER